jgi:hypothetical protein
VQRGPRRSLLALSFAAAALARGPAAAAPGCEALARFDASCARCHEAECSGRLSFGDLSHARGHVRRYQGALDDEGVADLIELLRATKEQCRVDPAAAASCGGPPWEAARLRRVRAGSERAWFVPLGTPASGPQRVVLRFDRDVGASMRIATAGFDPLLESSSQRTRRARAAFPAPGGEALFPSVQTDVDAGCWAARPGGRAAADARDAALRAT